jgi:phosphate transport system permease protein
MEPPKQAVDILPSEDPPKRRTRRGSVLLDKVMRFVITFGGLGVIGAFALIVFYLVMVVIPLFNKAELLTVSSVLLSKPPVEPLAIGIDDELMILWAFDRQGDFSTYQASTGAEVSRTRMSDSPIRSFVNNHGTIAIGRADGTVKIGRITPSTEYGKTSELPEANFPANETRIIKGAVAGHSVGNQVRLVRMVPDLSEPLAIGPGPASPIELVDYFAVERLEGLVAMRGDGRIFFSTITKKENIMTGEIKRTVDNYELPAPKKGGSGHPVSLSLGLNGRHVYLVYSDGRLVRYNTDDPQKAYVAEDIQLLSQVGASIASVRMLNGNLTLIVTDSGGGVSGWFAVPTGEPGKMRMVKAHTLTSHASPVTAIATSSRDRQFITADAGGTLMLSHMTSGTTQGKVSVPAKDGIACMAIAPKMNAVAALSKAGELTVTHVENPHPDGSLKQLFGAVHYEGYAKPEHVYQSSAGTDDAEMKLGMMPLIYGTLKATFYAMLFGVPIALLAAIYSSEFMAPKVRQAVKPFIELMASLPSVVLGYIGALVIAPHVGGHLVAVLTLFVAIPGGLMLFGYLWQIIPEHRTSVVPGSVRFLIIIILVALMALFAYAVGPTIEKVLFQGDFKNWLNGKGSATPGWFVALSPVVWLGLMFVYNKLFRAKVEAIAAGKTVVFAGFVELARFVLVSLAACGVAWVLGMMFNAAGWDLRGTLIGTYVQRNSMLLGLLMGFAIIPIIYTVSEDAFSRVPNSLRSASIGVGATRWQTAIRVVLPVAASGMFSAVMIGFGRAVGETMVVLMVSGRTPIMDPNPFNGLSALSANIATELPEAAVDTTHYRVLFLCGLILFVMTLVVNTTAEMIRARYRKKAAHL